MDSQFVVLNEVGRKVGFKKQHSVRNIRKRFPDFITRRRDEDTGKLVYVIPADKEEFVVNSLKNELSSVPIPRANTINNSAAERARKVFENAGWVVHLLSPTPVGTPDLIMYKNGVIRYREVKAASDGVRKDQWAEIYRLRSLGLDAWVCDDEGIDWAM